MSGFSRRDFCASAALGAIYLGVAGCLPEQRRGTPQQGNGCFEIPKQALDSVEYELTMADFRAQVGTSFTIVTDSGSFDLTLVAVNEVRPPTARGEAFACVFKPDRALELPQNTYRTSHAKLGTFPLFFVPLAGPDPITLAARPLQFAANFNRA